MNPHIREQDWIVAQSFWSRDDSTGVLSRFQEDVDGEIRADMTKLGVYLHLRDQGVEHVWAAMTACRRGALMANSDRAFNQHYRQVMEGRMGTFQEKILQHAQAAGISTQGKYYVSGLGGYDDPGAWVSTTDDVLSVCRDRNYTATGGVQHQGYVEPPKVIPLAEDLIEESIAEELADDPALAERYRRNPRKVRPGLREKVIAKYGQSTGTGPLVT